MPKTWIPIVATTVVAAVVIAAIAFIEPANLGAYGAIVSGGGSLLAVVWFSASLWNQSQQLQEQREQFAAQFSHLKESSRRDALLMAKRILDEVEQRAIAHHGNVSSVGELFNEYTRFAELGPLTTSPDPDVIRREFESWTKKEGAALLLMKGIKSAAEIYLNSIGVHDIDYTRTPEEFVYVYGPRFLSQPFFDAVHGPATMLADIMVRLEPGRKAATIAYFAAMAKSEGDDIVRVDKLRDDVRNQREQGYLVPVIAEDYDVPPNE